VGADGTPPVSIPLGILEPLRTSGQPYPPADIPPGRAVIKLCLDRDGAPTAARVMRSSGQRDRDSQLLHFVAAWHFRSFAVNGEPVDVCTIVTFAHRAPPATP
jgi:TonB family protein